jgi:hypothetical protein
MVPGRVRADNDGHANTIVRGKFCVGTCFTGPHFWTILTCSIREDETLSMLANWLEMFDLDCGDRKSSARDCWDRPVAVPLDFGRVLDSVNDRRVVIRTRTMSVP